MLLRVFSAERRVELDADVLSREAGSALGLAELLPAALEPAAAETARVYCSGSEEYEAEPDMPSSARSL